MDYFKFTEELKQKKFSNLYLFYGSESFLKREAISYIKNMVLPEGFRDVNYTKINGKEAAVDEIILACETQPFFSNRRLVVVENLPFFHEKTNKNSSEIEKLCSYLTGVNSETILVFTASRADKRRSIYKIINKHGCVVEFKMLKGKVLTRWIVSRLNKLNKEISDDALRLLCQFPFEHMEQLYNEIVKVVNFVGGKATIEKEDLLEVMGPLLENNVFELVDCIGKKDIDRAYKLLNDMLKVGQPEIFILFMMARHFKIILHSKLLSQAGCSFNKLVSETKQHPFVLKKALQQSKNFSLDELKTIVKLCHKTDISIKTGRTDPKLALETLMTRVIKLKESPH